jgi:hypothetical protein
MGMPQLVVTAVLVEGRSKSEVAREYGVSRRWVITLVQRYLADGDPSRHGSIFLQRVPANGTSGRHLGNDIHDSPGHRGQCGRVQDEQV